MNEGTGAQGGAVGSQAAEREATQGGAVGEPAVPAGATGPGEPIRKAAKSRELSPALDKTFKIGMVLKGLDGALEVIGGVILLFVSPSSIQHLVRGLVAHELHQDPHDWVANHLIHSVNHMNGGTVRFGAIYLLSHGLAKLVLVVLVLRDKLWAYPWMMGLLVLFIIYQIYHVAFVHLSIGMIALTVFDCALVYLTWREYVGKKAERGKPVVAPV